MPWEFSFSKSSSFDNEKWELYNLADDFSQANDVADKYPDKLRALQDLFWAEAAKHNVLPLDDRGGDRVDSANWPVPGHMALIARQWKLAAHGSSKFRGYDLSRLAMSSRDFVCKACSNYCDIKEFTIEGHKSFWGDKCSDKFRKPSATGRTPVVEDLFAVAREDPSRSSAAVHPFCSGGPACGWASRGPCNFDRYPFWHRYFTEWASRWCFRRPPTTRSPPTAWRWRWRSPATRFKWRTATPSS